MSNQIHIVCATDENYAPFASIMMKSVLEHTSSFVNFYVLDGGIQKKTKSLITKDLKKYPNKCIQYIDMTKYNLDRFPNVKHYSLNTFSRYFIPEFLPNIQRILYLDVDIIVTKDISELYNQDIDSFPIGAILEDFYEGNYTTLKQKIWPDYQGKDQYFNAGVLLLDIPKLIQMEFTKKAVNLTIQLFDKLSCPDQDVLNILFENNFQKLDYRFNFMPDHIHYLREKHPDMPEINPTVIHYSWIKPWKDISLAQSEFDKIAKNSIFQKRIHKTYHTKSIKKYTLFGKIPLFTWRIQ